MKSFLTFSHKITQYPVSIMVVTFHGHGVNFMVTALKIFHGHGAMTMRLIQCHCIDSELFTVLCIVGRLEWRSMKF